MDFDKWAQEMDCACGHEQSLHEHYTASERCANCDCLTYRTPRAVTITITIGWVGVALIAVALLLALLWF